MIKNYDKLLQCFKASCRVHAGQALGSATIVYSKDGNTFAITNFHVIALCISHKMVFDNILQKNITKQFTKAVEVMYPRMENDRVMGYSTVLADIVTYDKQQDIALLKFKDSIDHPFVGWYPRDDVKKIPILSELACIGAALGNKPVCTFGHLNGVEIEIQNYEYWLSTAQSIFGNSGGGVFIHKDEEWSFLGIPSRISVVPMGFTLVVPITHLGYFIPLFRMYDFLEDECYQFIFDGEFTPEQCDEMREAKKEEGLIKQIIKKKL